VRTKAFFIVFNNYFPKQLRRMGRALEKPIMRVFDGFYFVLPILRIVGRMQNSVGAYCIRPFIPNLILQGEWIRPYDQHHNIKEMAVGRNKTFQARARKAFPAYTTTLCRKRFICLRL